MHRIYVARLGPFGVALLMLIVGILAAVILLAVVGAVLIWNRFLRCFSPPASCSACCADNRGQLERKRPWAGDENVGVTQPLTLLPL